MLKVLIADDDLEFCKTIFNTLKNSNKEAIDFVNVSSNGKEALDYILNNKVDLLLLDLKMPKLTGIELLKEIKKIELIPNIIILTGDQLLLQEVFKINVPIRNAFIKPFNVDDLINLIDTIIEQNEFELITNKLYQNIVELLEQFNLNKGSVGYKYIVDCIIAYIENETIIDFKRDLYPKVAKKNTVKNSLRIQWALEKTIYAMNKYSDEKVINTFFPYGSPTPKSFIIRISNIIRDIKK